jgi:hypothetical protein
MRRVPQLAIALATVGLALAPATAAHADGAYVHFQATNSAGTVLGGVIFNPYGETAEVCDDHSDGNFVHGFFVWNGVSHELTDTNGAASGCATANYSIAEGTPVRVILCVDNYTPCWYQDTTA